jgi:ABC-type multidrug transport system fused ATPase/permease subunit
LAITRYKGRIELTLNLVKIVACSPYAVLVRLTPRVIRRRFYVAFFLVGAVGVLEVFSLSALLTFFTVGLNGGGGTQLKVVSAWMEYAGMSFTSALLAFALALFVVKAVVIFIVGRHSYVTSTAVKRYFQERLFDRFLHSPFQAHADKRSSDWVRSITVDCNALEGRFFMPLLVLLGEIIPTLCVCGVLLFVNATAFFVAIGIFGVVGVSVFLATHRQLVRLGQAQQTADGHIVQSVHQVFHGLRDLTIYKLQSWAQLRFESFTSASSRAVDQALSISLLPRFVFEVAIYISLGLVFTIYAMQGTPLTQVAGEFAVFGAAAMRLLPSVSKIVSHLQSLKHARPAVVAVTDTLLASVEKRRQSACQILPAIKFSSMTLTQVGFAYDDCTVLKSLDLEVMRGDTLGIIGSSGSGKSTLINLILGLLAPTQGWVMLNGAPLGGLEDEWWACIGYVPQEPFLMDTSAIENVMLGSASHDAADLIRACALIDLMDLPEAMKETQETIGEGGARLSGGQRQRLAIARALYRNPQVLILDEATSAMDVQTQSQVLDAVAKSMKGRTVLMVTHRTETLNFCNKIFSLPEGKFVDASGSHD